MTGYRPTATYTMTGKNGRGSCAMTDKEYSWGEGKSVRATTFLRVDDERIRYEQALEKIRDLDYRGNRHESHYIATAVLHKEKAK